MRNICDANCKAPSKIGDPELIHGLLYCYCEKCGAHHGLTSDHELSDELSLFPFKEDIQGHPRGRGRGKLILFPITKASL